MEKIEELKNEVIKLLKEKEYHVPMMVSGDRLFGSIPIGVPHGSEMTDVYIDITIKGDKVTFECDGGEGGGFDWDKEKETYKLKELSLHQLTLLLELIS